MALTAAETERYGRHLVMPEVGVEGQERLRAARVLLVGAGGLGSPAALYLAAAGVGTLGLVEFDRVETTNLQRQILYGAGDVGRAKTEVAAERLAAVNPHVTLEVHDERLTAANALELVGAYDLVIDGSDNFPTRYLVNDACVLTGTPNVYGSVLRFEGQVSVFATAGGPCYRCLFPEPPPPGSVPSCAEAGVLGVLPGIIGSLQALEAIKWILGLGDALVGRFLVFDGVSLRFRELTLPRSEECPVCSAEAPQRELIEYDDACEVAQARETSEGSSVTGGESVLFDISVAELDELRRAGSDLQLIDVRTPREYEIARIDGATLVPMNELPGRLEELDRERPLVVHCHHGPRSTQTVAWLRQQGFSRARNLAGGIDAWSREVDPSVPLY